MPEKFDLCEALDISEERQEHIIDALKRLDDNTGSFKSNLTAVGKEFGNEAVLAGFLLGYYKANVDAGNRFRKTLLGNIEED